MGSEKIRLLPESIFAKSIEASRKMYEFLQRDFEVSLEYIALDRNQLNVYSTRLADLILRSGPQIMNLLYLLTFYPRGNIPPKEPEKEEKLLNIQVKRQERHDTFKDYLDILPCLSNECVMVDTLKGYIIPFEMEKRKSSDVVFWWEDGYNALKHRAIREFEKSATLKHALYALAALWVLHHQLRTVTNSPPFYSIIKVDMPESELFSEPMDRTHPLVSDYVWGNLRDTGNQKS